MMGIADMLGILLLLALVITGFGEDAENFICRKTNWNGTQSVLQDIADVKRRVTILEERKNVSCSTQESLPSAEDCLELFDKGEKSDGVYRISPDNGCPFDVYCDMTNGGWTVMQRRKDGSVSFKRTWNEYVEGFGDLEGEFWLGLNQVHRLTKDSSQIYIHFQQYDGKWLYAHYKEFTVENAATAYKMNVDKYSFEGTIPELFSYHDNMKFSTHERDNDNSPSHCSVICGDAGWWFNTCYRYNPNGMYNYKALGGLAYYSGGDLYLKNSVIKLKGNKRC